jgi:hypothetical protein
MRWLLMMFGALCLFAAGLLKPFQAEAEVQPLELTIEPGFGGYVKLDRWFPVKFTIVNPGEDLSGDLAVHISSGRGSAKDFVYVRHVELPRQSSKVVWMALPGKAYTSQNNKVVFYRTAIGSGAPVPLSQPDAHIETRLAPSAALNVGVAARDPDTLNFLALLNQKGYEVNVFRLSTDGDFPWETAMLDSLDVIAFNDVPTDALKPDQVRAIQSWVERGGTLVLAGGVAFPKTAAAFGELSPVTYRGTKSVDAMNALGDLAGVPLELAGPFTVSDAEVKQGAVVTAQSGIPIAVHRPVGQGSVLYIAYDLALQPLAGWNGNATLWERLLSERLIAQPVGGKGGANVVYVDTNQELELALNYFPQLVPPSFGALLIAFLLYVVVVAPVLYAILKRFDRREWAWFVIPAIAVLSSAVIYGIGASGRSSILAQSLHLVELSGSGTASRTSATAVFVPSGGDYTLEWKGDRHVTPSVSLYGGPDMLRGSYDSVVRREPAVTLVQFHDVPYWSIRKAVSELETVSDAGMFEYSIRYTSNGIEGEIVNNTNTDVYEAGIMVGQNWIKIGELKKGDKTSFQSPLTGAFGFPRDLASYVFPYSGPNDEKYRERALLNTFLNKSTDPGSASFNRAFIVAFSRGQQNEYKVNGKAVLADQVSLLAQPVEIDYTDGNSVQIAPGSLRPIIIQNNLSYMSQLPDGRMIIGRGEMTYEYRLPYQPGWTYTRLHLSNISQQGITLEMWNETKQSWEPIDANVELDTERIADYLIDGRTVRLKVTSSNEGDHFIFSQLAVEGKVNP